MALLTVEQRKTRFEFLGLGEYNKENIKKFQKKYAEQLSEAVVLHMDDVKEKDGITFLPVYMTCCL